MKWSFIKLDWWSNSELILHEKRFILHEKWVISCGTLVSQPRPSSPCAHLHPTRSIRPNNSHCIWTEYTSEDRMLWWEYLLIYLIHSHAWADRGGGGPGPPPFGPLCRLFNIGPKIGPPPGPSLFLLVDLRWTPLLKNPGSTPGHVWYLSEIPLNGFCIWCL